MNMGGGLGFMQCNTMFSQCGRLHAECRVLLGIARAGHAMVDLAPWNCNVLHSNPRSKGTIRRLKWQCKRFCESSSSKEQIDVKKLLKKKRRLDELCVEQYPQYTRNVIQSWIVQGKVLVEGKPGTKSGMQVAPTSNIEITAEPPKYVCRAGYKLEAAIEQFSCDLEGKVILDSGLSTGGFADCLLQHGAARVYGVDVGYGQVAEKIRTDKRVCVIDRTNLRFLTGLPEQVDLATLDLSFISILLVMPAVCAVMKQNSSLITLIKPQFEASRSQVGGGGIVRDPEVHKEVRDKIIKGVEDFGFSCQGWMESPMKGADGNIEFLAYFHRKPPEANSNGSSSG